MINVSWRQISKDTWVLFKPFYFYSFCFVFFADGVQVYIWKIWFEISFHYFTSTKLQVPTILPNIITSVLVIIWFLVIVRATFIGYSKIFFDIPPSAICQTSPWKHIALWTFLQIKESAKWRVWVFACFACFTCLACSRAWHASKNSLLDML